MVGIKLIMNTTNTNTDSNRSKEIEEKTNILIGSFHTTIDSVNKLQQNCANLLLDYAKHYRMDVLNCLDSIEEKVEGFNNDDQGKV